VGARHIFAVTGVIAWLAVSTGTAAARCAARRHTVAPTASARSTMVACSVRPPGSAASGGGPSRDPARKCGAHPWGVASVLVFYDYVTV